MLAKDEKECLYCAEVIKAKAIKCRFCQSDLSAPSVATSEEPEWDEDALQDARDRLMADSERLGAKALRAATGAMGTQGMLAAAAEVEKINREVKAVSEAMERTTNGTYGKCSACHGPVALTRLLKEPTATLCEACAAVAGRTRAGGNATRERKTAGSNMTKAPTTNATKVKATAARRKKGACPVCERTVNLNDADGRATVGEHSWATGETCRGSGKHPKAIAAATKTTKPPAKRPASGSNAPPRDAGSALCDWCKRTVPLRGLGTETRVRVQHQDDTGMDCYGSGTTVAREHAVSPPTGAKQPAAETAGSRPDVPLTKWRGLRCMSRNNVPCACKPCGHAYTVAPEIANTLAQEQGVGARLQRWGIRTQHVGNQMTPGFGQLAMTGSGLEMDRQNRTLGGIMGLVACPRCGSTDILLGKDK